MCHDRWMIYGANGYTGKLIAVEAAHRNLQPVLAGRNAKQVESLAFQLNCPSRCFDLAAVDKIAENLGDVTAVLHCAGPFSETAQPMMDACISAGVHYLDITGEIDVIEAGFDRSSQATQAGVTMLPAVGMDVVPSDCLAVMLSQQLPKAIQLQLAFTADQPLSPGTARTIWQRTADGGYVRTDGRITAVPSAWKTLEVPFPTGPRLAMTIPWGDVASAYHSTGIPNIEVYAVVDPKQIRLARRFRWLSSLANLPPVQALGQTWIRRRISGPDEQARENTATEFWARVTAADGGAAEAVLRTPNAYALTVQTALEVMQRLLADGLPVGFQTPAMALGADFILGFPDVHLQWLTRP